MELKQNDRVNVDGVVAKIETSWGAGRHRIFKLDDGREIADLDQMIDTGVASIVVDVAEIERASIEEVVETPANNYTDVVLPESTLSISRTDLNDFLDEEC